MTPNTIKQFNAHPTNFKLVSNFIKFICLFIYLVGLLGVNSLERMKETI